jgi:class 3 adenylate cyclase/tetratricopeptide (TPR) repeat protein
MTITCPACGEENPERARFCNACGASLADATEPAEERKIVSVLFVDLVGFTGRSDNADPEDVRAILRPYHARMKYEIERFGGTIEKFVGDAVMAVFGAPAAHEDDAERAVRTALRILDAIDELNDETPGLELAVRAAVNTGEAVVYLAARPERGEGIATGDVVNTAARLQTAAPTGELVVGEATFLATRHVIDYAEAESVSVKGKARPLRLWRAVGARSRLGIDVESADEKPFVGRGEDLAVLTSTYARTMREGSIQLVTVTGEPGVGKTRLVAEFRRFVDEQPELVFWRQGRCLPYGEGITYWALGEMVKAQAGILESDAPEEAEAKLAGAVELITGDASECGWLTANLAPLVGITGSSTPNRDEAFSAWRRFLEGVATQRPLIVVFEDLHWADSALIEFLEHLVDWSTGVSMLIVCTARPELYERHHGWGGGKRNSTTISLGPLSGEDTSRLVAALLRQAVLPAETQTALLERCGGNPLYAEEFIRMLTDRGILTAQGSISGDGEIPVPETVQALIAARLDTLPADRKALLHDASVMGKVFWAGAVASMGNVDDERVRVALHELARKELVRPTRVSSVGGQAEYAFWHLLVRDVAYGQIPRAARARKHVAAAQWIEEMAAARVGDHAELLAYHYEQALELARAAGEPDAAELEAPAREFLFLAGERARRLDAPKAERYFARALSLAPDGVDRARILMAHADVTESVVQSIEELEQALELFRAAGDEVGAAVALAELSGSFWLQGRRDEALLTEAIRLLERHEPGPQLALAYRRRAGQLATAGESRPALEWSERALALAERLDLEFERATGLQFRGIARAELGDLDRGLADLREALRLLLERGYGRTTGVAYSNLASILFMARPARESLQAYDEAEDFTTRRGLHYNRTWMLAERAWPLYDLGEWDELIDSVERSLRDGERFDRDYARGQLRPLALAWKAHVLIRRGELDSAAALVDDFLQQGRDTRDSQVTGPAVAAAALLAYARGDVDGAVGFVEEFDQALQGRAAWHRARFLPEFVEIYVSGGASERAEQLVNSVDVLAGRTQHAVEQARGLLAEAHGEYEEAVRRSDAAAAGWQEFGFVFGRAQANAAAGRSLRALGQEAEARRCLEAARRTLAALAARPLLAHVEELLGDTPLEARA